MRRLLAIATVVALLAAAASADVVYLRNGKTHRGRVTRRGDKIIIQTADGTRTVDQAEVLYVSTHPAEAGSPDAASTPADSPADRAGKQDGPGRGRDVFSMAAATRPETVIFMLMQTLAGTPASVASYDLRESIEKWRILAHDRKRKCGRAWLAPEDFIRRRKGFELLVKEAGKLLRKSASRGRSGARRSRGALGEARALEQAGLKKLRAAAGNWADPLLADFLLAAAHYRGRRYTKAAALFAKCYAEAPLVAAFHQGRAMALMGLKSPRAALAACLKMVQLRPDSAEAIELLRQAMRQTPGGHAHSPEFIKAEQFLKTHPAKQRSRHRRQPARWLMPGRSWPARENALPVPAFDRLVFRQAVGVPVSPGTLLVDRAVIADALEVLVRIDRDTLVRAGTRRIGRGGKGPAPLVTGVTVAAVQFTPLEIATRIDPPGRRLTIHALPFYQEMGRVVRVSAAERSPLRSKKAFALLAGLAAGDGTSPVITDKGELAGFLAGKIDANADGGGPNVFVASRDLAKLIGRLARRRGGSYGSGRPSRGPAKTTARPAPGRTFIVYAIAEETFGQ